MTELVRPDGPDGAGRSAPAADSAARRRWRLPAAAPTSSSPPGPRTPLRTGRRRRDGAGPPVAGARVDAAEETTSSPRSTKAKSFARLDILVYAAGCSTPAPALQTGTEDWERLLRVNLTGGFVAARQTARHMKEHGGRMIFFSTSFVGCVLPLDGGLRRLEGRAAADGPVARPRVVTLRHHRQRHRARILRDRHAECRPRQSRAAPACARAHPAPAVRPAAGDRAARLVPRLRRVRVHDRRGAADRRRAVACTSRERPIQRRSHGERCHRPCHRQPLQPPPRRHHQERRARLRPQGLSRDHARRDCRRPERDEGEPLLLLLDQGGAALRGSPAVDAGRARPRSTPSGPARRLPSSSCSRL